MPHEHVILLEHTKLNSPHILGELQTLFTSRAVVQCSFKATIDIVRIFDNEWVWKFIIEFAHESWKPFEPADLLSQWNKVALTDNLDGLYRKWFRWTCHYFNYWREWVRRECGMLSLWEQSCDTGNDRSSYQLKWVGTRSGHRKVGALAQKIHWIE